MPTSSSSLSRINLKFERALKHIDELIDSATLYCESNRNAFVAEVDESTGDTIYRLRLKSPVPNEIALQIGDAAYNLRSTLDHLAWQLTEANGMTPDRTTAFVVCKSKETFDSSKNRQLKGFSTEVLQLYESIQPYQGNGIKQLEMLDDLNNYDKHRKLVVGAVQFGDITISGLRLVPPEQIKPVQGPPIIHDFGHSVSGKYGSSFLEDGHVIKRVPAGASDTTSFGFEIRLAFLEPGFLRHEPVRRLLCELAEAVRHTVQAFERFL